MQCHLHPGCGCDPASPCAAWPPRRAAGPGSAAESCALRVPRFRAPVLPLPPHPKDDEHTGVPPRHISQEFCAVEDEAAMARAHASLNRRGRLYFRLALALVLAAAAAAALSGCGGGSDEEDAEHDRRVNPPACTTTPELCR